MRAWRHRTEFQDVVPHHKFLLKHRQHTEHNCPLQPPALPSGIVMNADSDNGGVNKNKFQANLMKGVCEGGVMQNLILNKCIIRL